MLWLRRRWQWLIGPAAVGVAALIGWFVQTGDFLVMPGDAINTIDLVRVASAAPKPHAGKLLLTTIYSSPANADEWLFGRVYPHAHLEPTQTQLPPNTTYERFRHLEEAMMADSQTAAKVVALRQLGYDVKERGEGAAVREVQRGSAAEQAGIAKGDVIVAIDGQTITTASDLYTRLEAAKPGALIKVTVKSNNSESERELEVQLRAKPNEPDRALLGVSPATYRPSYEYPVQISIDSKGIIGPSGGLVLTLSIMQAISPNDLTHGHSIAATGTIELDGRVGAVGGIQDKIIAAEGRAEYFVVPKSELAAAKRAAKRVQVVEADTIDQAVDFLKTLA